MGAELRANALSLKPGQVGLKPELSSIWGFVMDSRAADGWYSLVAFSDGSTSLYTSSSFGIIGGGAHETVRTAGRELWLVLADSLALFAPMTSTDLPDPGDVALRLLTFDGPLVVVGDEELLGTGGLPASAVFLAAHEVLGRLRLVTSSGHPEAG